VVRTTALLYAVGGLAAALLAASALDEYPRRAGVLLVVALLAVVLSPVLLRLGPRLPDRAVRGSLVAASVFLAVGTALCPSPVLAGAASMLTTLVVITAMGFYGRRSGSWHALLATALQLVALLAVHRISVLVCASLATIWWGAAMVADSLARQAASSLVDSLTGLPNRRGWDTALDAALDRASRRPGPVSVALVDIDHFKSINDRLGHAAGDALLVSIAEAWRGFPADDAVLARRGGDEFALLLPGRDAAAARTVVEALSRVTPAEASCGVAQYVVGESASDLLRRADHALYVAKASGRGQVRVATSPDVSLIRDLTESLGNDDLQVHLQPVFELDTGFVHGFEALARWTHPTHGAVPPNVFIPAAEEAGIIVALGRAVLRRACADVDAISQRWGYELHLGVNVSGRELVFPGFADYLLESLEAAGWDPHRLVMEVTESLFEASSPTALETVTTLRSHGVRISIDDFGTGWSSLSRLDKLPVDYLKLDRSIVETAAEGRPAILRAVVALCRDLGIQVVAEGVETAEQHDLVRALGCEMAQGFHLARPMPAADFAPHPPVEPAQRGAERPARGAVSCP